MRLRPLLTLACSLAAATPALAQERVLHGAGWLTQRPGSTVDAGSRVTSTANRAPALVESAGGAINAGAGVAASAALVSQAHANAIGLSALALRGTDVTLVNNQVSGFVRAVGGAASANTVLLSGGGSRRVFESSRVTLSDNRAANVSSFGGKASVLLGAGSLQLPGRSLANGALTDESDIRRLTLIQTRNEARGVSSLGGSALANALTAAQSPIDRLEVIQTGNTARDVQAGGGNGGVAWGQLARAELTGVALANSVAASNSPLKGARIGISNNEAAGLVGQGGTAMANSFHIADHGGGALDAYRVQVAGNRAETVQAGGGSASVLRGALADVTLDASALANSVSLQKARIEGATVHLLTRNAADGIQAVGGGAAANSVWVQDATVRNSNATLVDNQARDVNTAGGRATLGGGVIGAYERNGRALAQAWALDRQTVWSDAPVTFTRNRANGVQGSGALAAANSVMAGHATVRGGPVTLVGNQADDLRASGHSGSVAGGLLFSTRQSAALLANSLGVFDSDVDAASLTFTNNEARGLLAQGGKLTANSVSVERGDGAASRLSATTLLAGNTAERISTGAGSTSGPLSVFGSESDARAAANAVVLHDGARVDAGSTLVLTGNEARGVGAVGGTALVNALAAYRGARLQASPVLIAGNVARDIQAGGGSGQAAGVGRSSNGILVANGIYLEGEVDAALSGAPVTLAGNTARGVEAQGGRSNANALAVNGNGRVQGGNVLIAGNQADGVRSSGTETTLFGHAVADRGVGHANANAVQVLGALRAASLQLAGNVARDVVADKGLALANSVLVDGGGSLQGGQVTLAGNTAAGVRADRHTALANGVLNQGRIAAASATVAGNTSSARSESGEAVAGGLRNRGGASITGGQVTIAGNTGTARGGLANGVDNAGRIAAGSITIIGNQGTATNGGVANGVLNRSTLAGSQITILGNNGQADGGTVNGVRNEGAMTGAQIVIVGNTGSTRGGGLANSVRNRGTIAGANILIAGNTGTAQNGTVNSVDNRGHLSGTVLIAGNRGNASLGGVANSLVNRGLMTGTVAITGNNGTAIAGGTSASVINTGAITGAVVIAGNVSGAAAGITDSSVRVAAGAVTGAAGVTGGAAWAANPGYTYTLPSVGVVNRSVTVGPAVNLINN